MSEKQTPTIDAGVVAVICHQANKALCERLGDFSQKDWNAESEDVTNAVLKQVESYAEGVEPEEGDVKGILFAAITNALLGKEEKPAKKAASKTAPKDK